MSTVSVSLPDGLKTFLDERVADEGYGTSGDYIRDLIRRDRDRQRLRRALLDGAASPLTEPVGKAYFEELRALAHRPSE